MKTKELTRGFGLLECFLSKTRAAVVDGLIPADLRRGRILDIGCGSYPYFLIHTSFREKFGIEKSIKAYYDGEIDDHKIILREHNLEKDVVLPFGEEFFDVITMLAVLEHINPNRVISVIDEVYRILKPGGLFIITTPAGWTGPILRILSKISLVSAIEINDHKDYYSPSKILTLFNNTRFSGADVKTGNFEMFLNMWATIRK